LVTPSTFDGLEARHKILFVVWQDDIVNYTCSADMVKGAQLNWSNRLHIIDGIAQGLLYLHNYSRLCVVHRDLKASNILLHSVMNPKISDFGMARIFCSNMAESNTTRIVGTQ
jgi:serine/threonine protein kinase